MTENKNILKKLLELQKEVKPIEKDSKNPYFNSAYFDINKLIDVLKPTLNKLGLVIYQPVEYRDSKNILKTILADVESGERVETSITLPDNLEPQKMGSAITYLRRYTLQSLLFLQAEDDDGSNASPNNTGKVVSKQSDFAPRKVAPKQNTKTIQNPENDLPFLS